MKGLYRSVEGEAAVMAAYEAILNGWPMALDQRRVSTRHGDTFVASWGPVSAPPLVLLHGVDSSSAVWAGAAVAFARAHRVFAVDLIGEPGKSAPDRPAQKGHAFADWLTDVLDGLGLDRTTVLGISQGGWIALGLAIRAPARVKRLVLVAPGGVAHDRWAFVLRAGWLSLRGERGRQAIKRLLVGRQAMPPELDELVSLALRQVKPRLGRLPLFTDDELRRLVMPTLLVTGALDPLRDGDRIAKRLRPLLPHLTWVSRPEAGHIVVDLALVVSPFLGQES